MSPRSVPPVKIRPWDAGDLWVLRRLLGDPKMMLHLGGAETPEAIEARHTRYLDSDPAKNGLFAIVIDEEPEPVGWVGYWETLWHGELVWECGWHVVPEAQRRGVASSAVRLLLDDARARGTHRFAHAFPAIGNAASNALCRALGFASLGEVDVEYPKGSIMRSNDWRLDLRAGTERRS